jgi:hypothetical protein
MATPVVSYLSTPSVVGRLRRELKLYTDVRQVKFFKGAFPDKMDCTPPQLDTFREK